MLHGRIRPFSRTRGAPGDAPTQAEATSWQAQVVTNGGSVSAARFIIVNNFIAAEKAAGTWALTDDYWGLWAEDTIGALTSLKQRRMGGSFGAPSFVPSRGYTFDGATNYVNTLFVPSTMAVAMTGTNLRIAVYERTAVATTTVAAGSNQSATQSQYLAPRISSANVQGTANSGSLLIPTGATSQGYTAFSRNNTTYEAWKNGLSLGTGTPGTSGTVLPTIAAFIGAQNSLGTAAAFRPASIGLVAIGASLSAAQEQAQYQNVQAWATAVGAQV